MLPTMLQCFPPWALTPPVMVKYLTRYADAIERHICQCCSSLLWCVFLSPHSPSFIYYMNLPRPLSELSFPSWCSSRHYTNCNIA